MKEYQTKLGRIRQFCADNDYDGMYLSSRANFSWLTCGGNNTVVRSEECGSADLLIMAKHTYVIASEIERYRITEEELGETEGFELVSFPWGGTAKQAAIGKLIGRKRIVSDVAITGMEARPKLIAELRYVLTEEEESRIRVFGLESALDLEDACRSLEPGITEYEAASRLMAASVTSGGDAPVVLVAFDERMGAYRHPIPTGKRLVRRALLARCSEKGGLIVSVSRIVSFGEPDEDFKARHLACAKVNASFIAATIPGAWGSGIFARGVAAYEESGYSDEWRKHHQGGAIGYATRDYIVDSDCGERVRDNQLFSWNPSISGTKIEDTIIVKGDRQEILTETKKWPLLEISVGASIVRCPAILVR